MSLFGSAGDGGTAKMEKARQAGITEGQNKIDAQFARFDPQFYDQAKKDYTAAVTPKVMEDYQATRNNLTYALARNGNLASSTAVQRNNSLSKELASNESLIANNAEGAANDLRKQVATQKGQLTQQLNASANPAAIAEQAAASTSQIRGPSIIQPLGNLFADWSATYLSNQKPNGATDNPWAQLLNRGQGEIA